MNHLLKRSLSLIMAILMVLAMIPANTVFAAEPEGTTDETVTVTENTTSAAVLLEEESTTVVNYDFTDATADEAGEGFAWNNDSKTLTLSGVAITEAVVLPAGSTIVVTEGTENSIKVASGDAVSSEGSLAITGAGKLTVVTADASAVVAPSVSITDTVVDLHGYFYGIQAKTTTGTADSVVTLTNVSGKIGGYGYGGINAHSETANIEVKLNRCYDLEMYNEVTNDSTSVNFNFAGIRAYTRGSGKDVLVELNNCQNVSISNSTMAILAANNANAANAEAANVKVLVQNSTGIELTGNTSCYSAVFVNNYGVENDDSSNLVIENSTVEVNAPNGSGLMTSTKSAPSEVDVSSSTITVTAGATGIRTIASSAEYADTDVTGSNITFKGNLTGNPVDVSAGGVVTDEAYADDESTVTVVMPATTYEVGTKAELDAAIAAAKDGDTIKLINDVVFDDVADIEARPAASNGNGKYCGFNYGNGAFVNVIGGNVTIDLNGHSITYDLHHEEWCNKRVVSIFYVTDKANLTVTDSVGTGAVTVYGMGTAAYSVAVDSKVTIEGGTWTWNPCKTCGATNAFLYASHGGEMYIKGGKFVNNVDGESGDYMIFSHYSSKETTENSAGVDYDSTKIEISGGTFDGYNPSQIKYVDQGNGNAEKKDDGCAPNFVPTENADGTYSVIEMCLEGSGTEADPYKINSLEDLIIFRNSVNAGNDYAGKIVVMTSDIDMTGVVWTPIGSSNYDKAPADAKKFAGIFDGGNHTITGLSSVGYVPAAEDTGSTEYSFGLFGYVYGADIKNVKFVDVNIECGTRTNSAGNEVYGSGNAALIGYYVPVDGKVSVIDNCHVLSGTISASNNMGGLIGHFDSQAMQPAVDVTISNCSNAATVTAEARDAGGILGLINGKREGNLLVVMRGSITFQNCVNYGAVTTLGGGSTCAGGILGRDNAAFTGQRLKVIFDNCSNSGTITVHAGGETHVAGLGTAFYSHGSWIVVKNSKNTGNIVVINPNNETYAGGLVAYAGVVDLINSTTTGNYGPVGDVNKILFLEKMAGYNDTISGNTYHLNGGTSPEYAALVDDADGGGNFHLVETAYKEKAEFAGWYTNPELTGEAVTALVNGQKHYYAKWNVVLEGEGTAENPYLISSVEEFIFFAKQTQNGNTYSGEIIKLANDIDFNGANILEIAEDGTIVTDYRIPKFSGTFDGDGKTIKNFNFVVKGAFKGNIMLFSQDNMWAYIRNLNIENVSVSVADITGETRISALANRVNAGGMTDAAIKNVHIKNFTVNSTNTTTNKLNISGFAYFVQGSQLIIKDSSIEGFVVNAPRAYIVGGAVGVVKSKCDMENVDVKAEFNIDYVDLIGGFTGQTQDNGTGTTFTDCDVEVKMNLGNSGSDVGGFIAQTGAASQFYKCTATGSINVTNGTSALSVGGFVGNLGWNGMGAPNTQHEFNNCVADVDITAVNANVGGFIGNSTVAGYPERFIPAYFNKSVAKGDVKTVNGVAGGFAGHGDRGIFNNCSASGNVEGRIAGGFWGEIYPKAKAESLGGWGYDKKEVTHTDANAKSIVLDRVAATGAVEGTKYEAGIIGFMKDVYVNADETQGYATPIVLNETPAEYNRYAYTYKVSTKAELNAALAEAQEGEIILLTADIDYGTDQLKIEKAITLDLGDNTLTTRNAYGGMSVKNDPTIKNGTIVHASNTAAIKVWNATAFEDLTIDVQGKGDANKTIGGIVLQSGSTTNVGSIKNVTIKGEALTNGIETCNCGDAAKNVIGSLENVKIDAVGTAMNISAPIGTATGCTFDGGVNGIELWIKGTYSASMDLVDCDVIGGVYAHDEFSTNPDIVNNGTLKLTVDETTTGADAKDVTLTIARAKEEQIGGILADVIETAQAKVNGTYYTNFAEAWNVANNGGTITLLQNYDTSILYVLNGVTLDLNGFILESDYVVVFNGGNIVDNSASNAGRLVVESNKFMIEENAQLPVKTESGYMFVTMEPVDEKWGQNGYYVAQFKIEAAAHELLKSNLAATGVSISIRVSWKNAAGLDRSQDFELPSAMLNEYLNTYKPNTGEYGGQIFLKLTNAPANTAIKYQVVIQSGNVEFTSNGYTK